MSHRSIGQSQSSGPSAKDGKNSYIKDYRSNGLVNKLCRTIGQSVLQTNHSIVKRISVERPGEQTVGPSVKRLNK